MNMIPVADFHDPVFDIYARLNEVQLLRYNEPEPGLFLAESPNVITRALQAGYEPVSFLMEEKRISAEITGVIAEYADIPVYTASLEVMRNLTGFPMTRGALCAMRRKKLPSVYSVCQQARRIAILEDVENPTNVGAIFRSAAGLGIDAVLLTESCSNPLYRRASRVSMGTVFQIPWTFITKETLSAPALPGPYSEEHSKLWPPVGMKVLHDLGFKTVAMALCENSISIQDPTLRNEEKLAILLGAEGTGLLPETIAYCDYLVKIPMAHGVDSLNVAAASAVAFWELTK